MFPTNVKFIFTENVIFTENMNVTWLPENFCKIHISFLTVFPCIARTLQLVMKELAESQSYCNLIAKTKGLVLSMMS